MRSPYELASKLAYSMTNTMPDDALFAAAAAGFAGTGNSPTQTTDAVAPSTELGKGDPAERVLHAPLLSLHRGAGRK